MLTSPGLAGCGELGGPDHNFGLELESEAPEPSLRLRARVAYTSGDHLGELARFGEYLYVANSNAAFTTLRAGRGELEPLQLAPPAVGQWVRCTTLAVHAPSRTLYCGSDGLELLAYDLQDPGAPRLRKPVADKQQIRDLHVDGDTLLVTRFQDGLWRAPIDPDGDLGPPERVALDGVVHHVSGDPDGDGPLAALVLERGLVTLTREGDTLGEGPALWLDGPLINLRVRGDQAVVALGSAGASIVALPTASNELDRPRERTRLTPAGVVTAADLRDDAAVLVTLTGVFLYNLNLEGSVNSVDGVDGVDGVGDATLTGFVSTGYKDSAQPGAALDGLFVNDDVVVVDWYKVDRLAIAPEGDILEIDAPGGAYARDDALVTIPLRNHGALELDVDMWMGDTLVERVHVGPGAQVVVSLPWWKLPDREGAHLLLELYATLEHGERTRVGERLFTPVLAADELPPAPGDGLPPLAMVDKAGDIAFLPVLGQRTHLVFHELDCAAMWPVLQDLAWLARAGGVDGATPVIVSGTSPEQHAFALRWGLTDMSYGYYGYPAPPAAVTDFNAPHGGRLYEEVYMNTRLPYGNLHPTDYLLDEDGVITKVRREYRGAHAMP